MNSELKKVCYNEASTTGRGSITCLHIDYASALPEVAKLYLRKPVKSLIALIIGKNLDAGELVQVDER